jgi:iron(III) transport system ATP-binding protein
MRAIEVNNVSKSFGARNVLHQVSFNLDTGGILCLQGPSGCGKTTLLRCIAGLETPDAGVISLFGNVVCGEGRLVPPMDRNIGMVFQDFVLWPHMRVHAHIEFVLKMAGIRRAERKECCMRLLDLCELEDNRRDYPNTLSGGQQQRLAIARAIATRPRLLLLDEPFSNLDDRLRNRIGAEILRLVRDERLTVILATHNPQDAQTLDCSDYRPLS